MNKSNPKSLSEQIPLFPPELPDDLNETRYAWLSGDWNYSVIDFIAVLISSKRDARKYWNDLKKRMGKEIQLSEIIGQLKLEASDGKFYETDVATREGLLRIVQSMPSNKVTGDKVERIKRWLAYTGAQAIENEANPELAAARFEGKISRKAFMQALQNALIDPTPLAYASATNEVYKGVLGRDAKTLRRELNTRSPRDKMSILALRYLDIAELLSSQEIGELQELDSDQANSIIRKVCEAIGLQVSDIERRFHIDILTGQRLLTGVDAIRGT